MAVSWEIIEPPKDVFAGGTTYMLARVINIGPGKLQNVYLRAEPIDPIHVEFKTSKDSGVWRKSLFIGDLNLGDMRTFYVRSESYESDIEGPRRLYITAKERWRICPACGH